MKNRFTTKIEEVIKMVAINNFVIRPTERTPFPTNRSNLPQIQLQNNSIVCI